MLTDSNARKSQSFLEDEELCGSEEMKSWEVSLHLMTKNQYAVQKKSNREKAQSLLDDENQLHGAEEIKCRKGKVSHCR